MKDNSNQKIKKMKQLSPSLIVFVLLLNACTKSQDCDSKLIDNCAITFEFDPVCGCNDITYSNPSDARCHSINEFTKGKCLPSLVGDWDHIGFVEDGARLEIDKTTYAGSIINLSIKTDADNNLLSPFEGIAQPNRYNGKYFTGNDFRPSENLIATQIAGTLYESKYFEHLTKVKGSKIQGNYMLLKSSIDEKYDMVFKKTD